MSKKKKHSQNIDPATSWVIFAGIPIAIIAILLASTMRHGDIRGVSEKALPYVLLFGSAAIIVGCRELYHHCPRRLIIPLGVSGWVIAVTVMCWYYWFGPGSFGYGYH
jgi:hypothetical protein